MRVPFGSDWSGRNTFDAALAFGKLTPQPRDTFLVLFPVIENAPT
jgi:hypothetical protein